MTLLNLIDRLQEMGIIPYFSEPDERCPKFWSDNHATLLGKIEADALLYQTFEAFRRLGFHNLYAFSASLVGQRDTRIVFNGALHQAAFWADLDWNEDDDENIYEENDRLLKLLSGKVSRHCLALFFLSHLNKHLREKVYTAETRFPAALFVAERLVLLNRLAITDIDIFQQREGIACLPLAS